MQYNIYKTNFKGDILQFFKTVYEILNKIPQGKVATYGQIAGLTGFPKKSREVGWALHANKEPVKIPCHRVVDRNGNLAKGFAFGGVEAQKKLLEKEGVKVSEDFKVDLKQYLWKGL